MRARLKSGSFHTKGKVYRPGDMISDISKVPEAFHDMWELIEPPVRKTPREPEPEKEVKTVPKPKPVAAKKKPTTKRTAKRTAPKRTTSKKKVSK